MRRVTAPGMSAGLRWAYATRAMRTWGWPASTAESAVRERAPPMARDRATRRVLARAWRRVTVDWRGRCTVAIGLAVWVVTWWLIIAGAVAVMLPDAASTPAAGFIPLTGRTAHIEQPGIPGWPIPVDRRAYDEYYRGYQESDDDAIDHAFAAFEWIAVEHHQAVRIIEVDGEAHHGELLEGPNVGRRGWLKSRHLGP